MRNYFEFDGEIVLVTGASGGLGRHFSQVLAAAGAVVCVAARRLDKIYETQNKWTLGSDIVAINNNLKDIVEKFGINSMQFDKCLNNEKIADKILNERIDAQKKYAIDSTPTVIINEKKLEGSADFKNIKKKIEKLI